MKGVFYGIFNISLREIMLILAGTHMYLLLAPAKALIFAPGTGSVLIDLYSYFNNRLNIHPPFPARSIQDSKDTYNK